MTDTVGVVTGAGSGMGQACVERLRGQVDHLIAVDVETPALRDVVGIACDITNQRAIDTLVTDAGSRGEFRFLVHAAGLSPSMATARRVMEVNAVGTANLLAAFEPKVLPGSVAVCFSSAAGYFPVDLLGAEHVDLLQGLRSTDYLDRAERVISDSAIAYIVSKAAVQHEAQRAAIPWSARGGRVVSVSPGTIDTPMAHLELQHQPLMHEQLAAHPMKRLGDPREVAAVVSFLVSPDASFVSGVDILVDGGSRAAELLQLNAPRPPDSRS